MKTIRYFIFLVINIIFIITLTGCNITDDDNNQKIKVITTIFPVYDFTREIAQDKVDIKLILPPGLEPHTYLPKPRGIFEIRSSDLFIYTGDFLEVWAQKIVNVLDEDKVKIVTASSRVNLSSENDEHEDVDPHIWLDPYNAMIMVDNILQGLIEVDPENTEFYQNNAEIYKAKLIDLDQNYQNVFNKSTYNTIIFGGHFVFGYLANRYDLNYTSPYKGFSPDALPTPRKIQTLIKLIKSTGQKTIFYEELINPRVAEVIAEQTGAKMISLNGAGNISKEDLQNNVSYIDIMEKNIENLKEGLGYNE